MTAAMPTRSALATPVTPSAPAAVDALLSRLRPVVADAVDTLHVAAVLESSGITDALARDRYDHPDVFALATTLRDRAAPAGGATSHPGVRPPPVVRRRRRVPAAGASNVGHGLIYLLPALCMPALLHLVGTRYAALALVVGASVGWLWAVLATWRAYGVLSLDGRPAAEDHLRRSVLVGTAAGVLAGAVLVLVGRTPTVVGVVAAGVTAAQLGTTLLFFLRRRAVLVVVLVAQGVVGLGNLLAPEVVPAGAVLGVFVLATLILLLVGGVAVRTSPTAPLVVAPGLLSVLGYAVASVAFLLIPQVGFLRAGGGLALALAGLFLTMGFVEWRGGALSARLRSELARSDTPARFRRRAAGLALGEGAACLVVTAVGTGGVLLALRHLGMLSRGVLVVALATVTLAAAYLLSLVLANTGAYTWLASSFAGGAVVETTLWGALGTPASVAFAVAAGLLLVVLLVGLLGRPVNRFR